MSSTGVSRIAGIDPFTSFKAPCTVATTANIALSGAQTVDGVAVAETTPKTRVLVKDQTDQTENGIYDVYDTSWVRSDDFNGTRDATKGTMINIQSGTSWTGVTFRLTTSGTVTFGTSSITFESANPANTTTVIGAATLDTYAELRAINTGQYSNGDIIYISGSGIAGEFRLVNSVAHGLSDNGGTIIKINDDWYAQRVVEIEGIANVQWWGAVGDGSTDCRAAVVSAAEYLLGRTWPGGTIYFPKTALPYVMSNGVDFLDILFTEQGMTLNASGHFLPNGELARNVGIKLQGDQSVIKTTSGFTNPYLFKWGEFTSISIKQAMKAEVDGLQCIGPGSTGGHVATTYVSGGAGYTSSNSATLGTDNTTSTCFLFDETTPPCIIRNTIVSNFNKALETTWGFGFTWESGSILYCNVGIHGKDGSTNLNLGDSLEIELCAVGLFCGGDKTSISGTIIEANQLGILFNICRFFDATGLWLEGNTLDFKFASDAGSPSIPSEQINIYDGVGPSSIDSNSGLRGLHIVNCAVGDSFAFAASTGNVFKDIVFDHCTLSGGAFDISSISVSGIATLDAITVKGEVANATVDDYEMGEPLRLKGVTATATASAQPAFDIVVPNIETTARIEIRAWKSAAEAADMRLQSMYYVGVIRRYVDAATIVEFSTTESLVTAYNTTGTNAPVAVSVPTTSTTGATTAAQTITVEFPTGTAAAGTAQTMWEVEIRVETGDLTVSL